MDKQGDRSKHIKKAAKCCNTKAAEVEHFENR